jgi:tRNA (mo5U34)-methyltransferase
MESMFEAGHGREDAAEKVSSVGFWWHSIDVGQGVVTPGIKQRDAILKELQSLRLPPLEGKSVLDIGTWDGFYSFEAERLGANRVVALDQYVWSIDMPGHYKYWHECKERGIAPALPQETPYWHPDTLPGRRGFDTAHALLGSRVQPVAGDFMTMDLEPLGTFDVVLFLGVLYHMEDPMAALRRVASLTREVAIIETHAVVVPGHEHLELCEFYSSDQLLGDYTNWWGPNLKAMEGMCQAAGFSRVEVLAGPPAAAAPSALRRARSLAARAVRRVAGRSVPAAPGYYRAVVHAWK